MTEDDIDSDSPEYDANDQYWPGWCPWCGDPEDVCQCEVRPEEDEMDEWSDDETDEDI